MFSSSFVLAPDFFTSSFVLVAHSLPRAAALLPDDDSHGAGLASAVSPHTAPLTACTVPIAAAPAALAALAPPIGFIVLRAPAGAGGKPLRGDYQLDKDQIIGSSTFVHGTREAAAALTLPEAGEYVLGYRMDCESSAQVWSSCADVTIVDY